jgi:serine protease Do
MMSIRTLVATLVACAVSTLAAAQSADTAFPEAASAAQGTPSAQPKFEFTRIRSKVAPGDRIGWVESGMFCTGHVDLRANVKAEEIATDEARAAFKTVMNKLGLAMASPDISSFDAAPVKNDPDYRVGGVLQTMSLGICNRGASHRGEFAVSVKWEVFSPRQQKVVFSLTTSGNYRADSFEEITGRDFEVRAYVMSLQQLMSDPGFRALKANDDASTAASADAPASPAIAPLHLKSTPAGGGATQANANALRTAVATVMHENVSGSGFYVADGYLLTNRHVVGSAHYVKVKLASGRVLVGEVVREDARRDVALVKTESAGVPSLHVNMGDPAVGSDVYAIGSPLGQDLAGTVTRGVMSGTRDVDGREFLQSDVAINPGNSGGPLLDGSSGVVAMAVARIDKAAGLSFFIPIREAANSLQLIFD